MNPFVFLILVFGLFPASAFSKPKPKPKSKTNKCTPIILPSTSKTDWRKNRSKLLTKVASPRHFARDTIGLAQGEVVLSAKFTYGAASKDLEGETIDVFVSDCQKTTRIATAITDKDGWVDVRWKFPKKIGAYDVVFRVGGDHTTAQSRMYVLAPSKKLVIFDIDGTLTPSDHEIMKEVGKDYYRKVGNGTYDPQIVPFGQKLVNEYKSQGYQPVYLSGRPYWLGTHTRDWIKRHNFADGPSLITRRHRDVAPTIRGVGQFKLRTLNQLLKHFQISYAHGNAETDIHAYLGAGIPTGHVFILGPHGGKKGTIAVTKSWQQIWLNTKKRAKKTP